MGTFLNSSAPYEGYSEVLRDSYFVDKTLFLNELIPYFGKRNRYCRMIRPRRFGKTVMANMVGAFFGKTAKERLFDKLAISKEKAYNAHLNQHGELLLSKDSLGYVYHLAKKSDQMLQATLTGDTQAMEKILQFAHNTETPILSYNSETELSAIVNLCYLSAYDKYRVEREDKAGKGFVDFIFYPEKKSGDCIILELKVDSTPQEAIAQIKEKGYALRFKGRLGQKPVYTGRILAVGIGYDKGTKEHHCCVEALGNEEL